MTVAAAETAADPPETHPWANALTRGFRTPIEPYPDNREHVLYRQHQTFYAFSPRNPWQEWLTDDIALMLVRLDRLGRIERRERDRLALRAESFWDDDRRLLAEDIGANLAKNPARVVKRLQAMPQGCDWLMERWKLLGQILDAGKPWDEAQGRLALDMLGTPKEVREATSASLADPARLVRDELAALEARKVRVAESDALERSLAMADMIHPTTPEIRQMRRLEAAYHRRMRWSIEQLELIPKFAEPEPNLVAYRKTREEGPPASEPEPEPEPEATPPDEVTPPPRSRRPDPAKLRAKARQRSHRRGEDRRDC